VRFNACQSLDSCQTTAKVWTPDCQTKVWTPDGAVLHGLEGSGGGGVVMASNLNHNSITDDSRLADVVYPTTPINCHS